jgi:hypothetical protein
VCDEPLKAHRIGPALGPAPSPLSPLNRQWELHASPPRPRAGLTHFHHPPRTTPPLAYPQDLGSARAVAGMTPRTRSGTGDGSGPFGGVQAAAAAHPPHRRSRLGQVRFFGGSCADCACWLLFF